MLALVSFASLSLGACGVGDDTSGDGDLPINPIDPNPAKKVCSGGYTLTGTFVAGTPARPAGDTGCWPVGKWTFTTAVDPAYVAEDITGDGVGDRCADAAVPRGGTSFDFTVNRTPRADGTGLMESYTYGGTASELYKISMSELGNGDCQGGVELYFDGDKSYINLKPNLTGTMITGHGDFVSYLTPHTP